MKRRRRGVPGEEFELGDEVCSQGGSIWTAFVPHPHEQFVSRDQTGSATSGLSFLQTTQARDSQLESREANLPGHPQIGETHPPRAGYREWTVLCGHHRSPSAGPQGRRRDGASGLGPVRLVQRTSGGINPTAGHESAQGRAHHDLGVGKFGSLPNNEANWWNPSPSKSGSN